MSESNTPAPSLYSALIAAQGVCKPVDKGGTNKHFGYAYASAEAIMQEARDALNVNDLAVIMTGWTITPGAPPSVEIEFQLIHGASNNARQYKVSYPAIEERGRPLDKAISSALTYAEGYFLRGLLCMPRVDARDEVDERDDSKYAPVAERPASAPVANGARASEAPAEAPVSAPSRQSPARKGVAAPAPDPEKTTMQDRQDLDAVCKELGINSNEAVKTKFDADGIAMLPRKAVRDFISELEKRRGESKK